LDSYSDLDSYRLETSYRLDVPFYDMTPTPN
jgi:hypothetical protein